jgi:branched-chain amino acid transport system substrate-binding protein
MIKTPNTQKLAAAVFFACGLALVFSPVAMAADTVNVGLSTGLTGSVASLGITGKHGVSMAIDKLNGNGGLLGKKIKLLTADGQLKPNIGVTNVRNFILKDQVKAIFGPLSSAVGAAEAQTAAQYHTPIFFFTSNDVDQTGKYFSKYSFQVAPTTYMEPRAEALYIAKQAKKHDWKTLYTIGPNYSFGHDTVDTFLASLKAFDANMDVIGQQWPKLGASDYSQYISAALSKHPDFLFLAIYGGDLVTFTKQAEGYNLFKKMHAFGGYLMALLQALGKKAPTGAITVDRANPFYYQPTKTMQQFTKKYHDEYGEWPSTWAILGYTAVQTWAQGVNIAGSFDADKVVKALSGAKIKTLNGSFEIRSCDHLAEVPEYVGVVSKKVKPKYGIKTMADVFKAPPKKIMMSCDKKKAMRNS